MPALAQPRITAAGNVVSVPAGEYRVGEKSISVAKAGEFRIDLPGELLASEMHRLTGEKPDRWIRGTHLKGLIAGGTPLPGCLDPTSVVVKLADGTKLERAKDYLLDSRWGGFARVEGGRISAEAEVTIDFRIGQMRIDTIEVDARGISHLRKGKENRTCPHPPDVSEGAVAIANIFMPYHAKTVEPWQIFPIVEPAFPAAPLEASLLPKTLGKLRAGEPLTIVTWGDSVTANGDASSSEKALAQLFPAQLQKRFPKSNITHHNAGIGGTSTPGRFPALQKEVLDFHPDLVTIEFINDMGLPEADMRARYAQIFKQIRDAGAEIILITPHFSMPEMMGKPNPRGPETRATVSLLREMAREHQVALADTSKRWEHLDAEGIPYNTLLVNGINHPDDRGHAMFVEDLLSLFPQP